MNVGIIGAGGIANKLHLPELTALPGVTVTHLTGRTERRLRLLSERFDVPHWTHDYQDVLADDTVDAVVITTPHPLHVGPGIDALQAGKHVLMQKPLCDSMADADRFVEVAERAASRGQVVMCLPHFAPAIYAMRRLIGEGAIGKVSGATSRTSHGGPEVYYAQVRDALGETNDDLWFFDEARASVGALFGMGVYAASMLIAALGPVRRIFGRALTLDKPTTLEDTATVLLEFQSGALGTLETGWLDPARSWYLNVHGTRGKLTSPGHEKNPLTHWTPGSYTREDVPAVPAMLDVAQDDRGNAHEHWLRCIVERRQPELSNAHLARYVTEVLLAGRESARTGQLVEICSEWRELP